MAAATLDNDTIVFLLKRLNTLGSGLSNLDKILFSKVSK